MLSLQTLATIATIIVAISKGCNWLCPRIYKQVMAPTITWGFIDCPTELSAHYFLTAKIKKPVKLKVKIKLTPICMQPEDYSIKVKKFYNLIGREVIDEISTTIPTSKESLTVEFDIDQNCFYRIIIEATGGPSDRLLTQNFELVIECSDAIVKYKEPKKPI